MKKINTVNLHELYFVIREDEFYKIKEFPSTGYVTTMDAVRALDNRPEYCIKSYYSIWERIQFNR